MPTTTRKSSLGNNRRGPQKAHIPYRGDNPEVGKKTGIAVQHVERKSDGFEPFDELIQAADGLTPPQRKARRKSLAAATQYDDDDDDDGEQSMQIDSPVQHLVNLRPPISPPTVRRKSSIRPIARTSDVYFDQIPSPRPMGSLHKALLNGGGPGPSTLAQSRIYREPERSASPNGVDGEYDYRDGEDDDQTVFEGHSRQESTRGRMTASFSQIDQDDDEEEEEEEDHEPTPKPTRQQNGKGKAVSRNDVQNQDEEMENEIVQGLDDVELEPESDISQEMPPVKRSKISGDTAGKATSRSKKENRVYREGTRRSKRQPQKPLAYWRGERYVYGRSDAHTGPVLVPPVREVIRIREEPAMQLGGKRKRGTSRARSRSKAEANEDRIPPPLPVENPEEGWDDATEAQCFVLDFKSQEERKRRIAWTAKMVEPKMSARNNWSFDKVFNDDDFIAAGQLVIPPKGRKPSKQAKDNTYVFYVIEGAVNLKIHNTSMILATGGMFMVPRGNFYFIENISNRVARLFFTQARKLEMTGEERKSKEVHEAEALRRGIIARSSSVGVTPSKKIRTPTRPRAVSDPAS